MPGAVTRALLQLAHTSMTRSAAYWTCQTAGWSLYALANVGLSLALDRLTAPTALFGVGVATLGLAVTHVIRAVVRRRRWLDLPVRGLAVRVVAVSTVAAAFMVVVVGWATAAFGEAVGLAAPSVPFHAFVVVAFTNWSFLLGGWTAAYVGVHLVERWRTAEAGRASAEAARAQADAERWRLLAAVTEAELRALQAQVHPHFLFNSLNTVRTLVAEDPARAEQAVTDLADLLRYALAAGRHETVPLGDELDAVEAYLALETLRFERRLRTSVDADAGALGVQVPPFAVQTLVENGVKHGVALRPEGGALRVVAAAEVGSVRVTVESTGRYEPANRPEGASGGVGLSNATERLARLCPGAMLTVRQSDVATVTAEIVLPVAAPDARPTPTHEPAEVAL